MNDRIWPDLIMCEHGDYVEPDEPPNCYPTTEDGRIEMTTCECSEPNLTFYWSSLPKHQAYAVGRALRSFAEALGQSTNWPSIQMSDVHSQGTTVEFKKGTPASEVLDKARSVVHDDRMIESATHPPVTTTVTRLLPDQKREVLTNPDFIEFVEQMAEDVRRQLQENDGLEDRFMDLVMDLFRPDLFDLGDTEKNMQYLQNVSESVMRLALDELAPLLVRLCITGDWRDR